MILVLESLRPKFFIQLLLISSACLDVMDLRKLTQDASSIGLDLVEVSSVVESEGLIHKVFPIHMSLLRVMLANILREGLEDFWGCEYIVLV